MGDLISSGSAFYANKLEKNGTSVKLTIAALERCQKHKKSGSRPASNFGMIFFIAERMRREEGDARKREPKS